MTSCAMNRCGAASTSARIVGDLVIVEVRADHHAGAAGTVDRLDDQFVQPVPDALVLIRVGQHPGADVTDQRLPRRGSSGSSCGRRHRWPCRRRRRCRGCSPPTPCRPGKPPAATHSPTSDTAGPSISSSSPSRRYSTSTRNVRPSTVRVTPSASPRRSPGVHDRHAHRVGQQPVLVPGGVVRTVGEHRHLRSRTAGSSAARTAAAPTAARRRPIPVTAARATGCSIGKRGRGGAPVGHGVAQARRHPQVVLEHHPSPGRRVQQVESEHDGARPAAGREVARARAGNRGSC